MQVILEDARESYREDIIIELVSNTVEDMEANAEKLQNWITEWVKLRESLPN